MKTKLLSILLTLSLALGLMAGCTVTAELPEGYDTTEASTTVVFQENGAVSLSGTGAMLDGGEVVIAEAGVYELSGVSANSRVIVKADDAADVTLILAGLELTNPLDEAIYFKTCGSASVILMPGTENILTSGEGSTQEDTLSITDENEDPSGAALRALCAMTVSGEGSLTVNGYINNGIAADGGLTIPSGTYTVTAVNDGLKSDGDVAITGGTLDIRTDCDGVQAGNELIITGGEINILTGAGAEGAEMKVSDSLMMGGGMGGGRNSRSSSEASTEAAEETETETADNAAVWTNTVTGEEVASAAEETTSSSSREMGAGRGMGGFDDMMDTWDYDSSDTPSRKGLKAGTAMILTGGTITVDAEDDAIHCDGSVTVSGGKFTLSSGDDGIHGETTLDISGGETYILLCYEGLEATAILISDGYLNITATDDGMNANGGMGMMGGPGGMGGNRGGSQEASAEAEETTADEASAEAEVTTADTASAEAEVTTADTASAEAEVTTAGEASAEAEVTTADEASAEAGTASQEAAAETAETETLETIVRISGGTVIVNSGGDGLDSNANMYIEGGAIFVSGPSSNWDSPIDYGDGNCEFLITGGTLLAAGYSGMFESPDATDASQASIYYIQSGYAPDNAVTTLTAADGTVIAQYAFANSYNGVLISTPEMAAGETYTLTIDGVDTVIEMTAAQYSNRGGSGEMGGRGGRP